MVVLRHCVLKRAGPQAASISACSVCVECHCLRSGCLHSTTTEAQLCSAPSTETRPVRRRDIGRCLLPFTTAFVALRFHKILLYPFPALHSTVYIPNITPRAHNHPSSPSPSHTHISPALPRRARLLQSEVSRPVLRALLYKVLYSVHASPRAPCVAIQLYSAIQRYTLYSYTSLYTIQAIQHPSGLKRDHFLPKLQRGNGKRETANAIPKRQSKSTVNDDPRVVPC